MPLMHSNGRRPSRLRHHAAFMFGCPALGSPQLQSDDIGFPHHTDFAVPLLPATEGTMPHRDHRVTNPLLGACLVHSLVLSHPDVQRRHHPLLDSCCPSHAFINILDSCLHNSICTTSTIDTGALGMGNFQILCPPRCPTGGIISALQMPHSSWLCHVSRSGPTSMPWAAFIVVVACVSSDGYYMAGHQWLHIDSGVITVLHDSYSSMRQLSSAFQATACMGGHG
jgi:hypothetical protein